MKDVHAQNLQPCQNNFLLNIDKKNFEDKKLSCFSELKESLSQKLMIFVDIRLFNSNNNISNNNNNNSGNNERFSLGMSYQQQPDWRL